MKPRIIVCNLGQTGYRIFRLLRQQGAIVTGIHRTPIKDEKSQVVVGNPAETSTLLAAGIETVHTLILAGDDDAINLEILMQARILNPQIRIINRLFNSNLGERLDHILTDHTSMSVSSLAAPVFAFSALGNHAIGQLKLFDQIWPIREELITSSHPWCGKLLSELWSDPNRMLIYYLPIAKQIDLVSAVIENKPLEIGDRLIMATRPKVKTSQINLRRRLANFGNSLRKFQQYGRSALGITLVLLTTILVATLTYVSVNLEISIVDALYFSVGMITGAGGQEDVAENAPATIKIFTTVMMLVGTAVIGICYALLNDFILGTHLTEYLNATRIPRKHHYVICGLGGIGINIAQQLTANGYEVVVIEADPSCRFLTTVRSWKIPLILGDASLSSTLASANISQAEALIAVTSNDTTNLEIALSARGLSPEIRVVVRSQDPQFAQLEQQVFDFEVVLSPTEIAAPAFAAAAIGGRILGNGIAGDSLWIAIATLITPNHPFCHQRIQDAARIVDFVPLYVETQQRRVHSWELLDFCLHSGDILFLTLPAQCLEQLWQPMAPEQAVSSVSEVL
ncbi:MAG: potassium channel protein [Oscillatoriales cyanobacterium RM2_1_1]|nr:potassium channel protein [Oscillatoriales cyanobacterium SM2_3_0]NJO45247.1 potassium channel protein [Oscillatoriales cyanobacterium RM2_1_1]